MSNKSMILCANNVVLAYAMTATRFLFIYCFAIKYDKAELF